METLTVNNQVFSKGQMAVEAFNKMEKLLSGLLIRKGYTKTHTVKIGEKQFITFEAYRALLLGKRNKTYFGDIDIIIDVVKEENRLITYIVKDEKSGWVRTHGTTIKLSEVF